MSIARTLAASPLAAAALWTLTSISRAQPAAPERPSPAASDESTPADDESVASETVPPAPTAATAPEPGDTRMPAAVSGRPSGPPSHPGDAVGWDTPAASGQPHPSPADAARAAPGEPTGPPSYPDDAVGWDTPAASGQPHPSPADAARAAPNEPNEPTRYPDDAAGWGAPLAPTANDASHWGAGPSQLSTDAAPSGSTRHVAQAGPGALHLDIKLRERAGAWLERRTPSRLAQLRSSLELNASYSQDFSWNTTPANIRAGAGVRGEYDAAYLFSRGQYDQETLDAYELRLIGLETFLGLRVGLLELRTGRLINTLGQGELQSLVDLLNPRDLRQLGLTPIDSIRLPAWTTRIALSDATFRIEAFIVHEAYFGMLPPLLGNFSPVRKLLLERDTAADRLAEHNFQIDHVPMGIDPRGTQFIGRYGYTGAGLDLDLYAGTVLDQLGVAALPSPAEFEEQTVPIQLYHPRFTMIALTGAKTLGDFVLRWELGSHIRRSQSVRRLDYEVPVIETQRFTQLSGLLGFTYFGVTDVNFGAELMQSYVLRNPTRDPESNVELLWPVEAPSLSLRYQHYLFDQRFTLQMLALIIGVAPFNGALVNVGLSYFPRDGLTVLLEYVHYATSSHFGYFYGFENNDRVDLSVTWALGVL